MNFCNHLRTFLCSTLALLLCAATTSAVTIHNLELVNEWTEVVSFERVLLVEDCLYLEKTQVKTTQHYRQKIDLPPFYSYGSVSFHTNSGKFDHPFFPNPCFVKDPRNPNKPKPKYCHAEPIEYQGFDERNAGGPGSSYFTYFDNITYNTTFATVDTCHDCKPDTATPEPGTLGTAGLGLSVLGFIWYKKQRKN